MYLYSDIKETRERNIKLVFYHVFCYTIYQSICQWNLFDAYLSFLAKEKGFVKSNTWVGFAEGIIGVTTLVLAFPLGVLVDSFDRILILRTAGIIGIIATCISSYAFAYDHLTTLYTNLFLWGLFTGLQGTATEAVFADSIEQGKRSEKFTLKGVLNTCGLSLGPLLMLGIFLIVGDEWQLSQLHLPLLIGCCFAPLCCIPLFLMKDPKPHIQMINSTGNVATLKAPLMSPALRHHNTPLMAPNSPMLKRDRIGSHCSELGDADLISHKLPEVQEGESAESLRFKNMSRGDKWIPYIITTSDFITEVGAGMTVRFFPLFFITSYHVQPIALCAIFCIYPLCVSMAMPLCQRLGCLIGRAQASFTFQAGGVLMLLLMTYVESLPFLIVVFMLRGQLQNAAYPVDRSIIMDYIPSKHRGKWNSIASLTSMTWSGSAVLGGFLADKHDYRFTFLITAVIYFIGILCYLPLLWLVPRVEAGIPTAMAVKTTYKQIKVNVAPMDTLRESPIRSRTETECSDTPYTALTDKTD